MDDLSTGRLENIEHLQRHPRFACTIGSVMDEAVLGGLIERADVVFHLAAGCWRTTGDRTAGPYD
jgi:UDP-glucose 4-epimerase